MEDDANTPWKTAAVNAVAHALIDKRPAKQRIFSLIPSTRYVVLASFALAVACPIAFLGSVQADDLNPAASAARGQLYDANPDLHGPTIFGRVTGESATPIDEALQGVQNLQSKIIGLGESIEHRIGALAKETGPLSLDAARAMAAETKTDVQSLHAAVAKGGPIDQSLREAIRWAESNRSLAASDPRLSPSQQREIAEAWQSKVGQLSREVAKCEAIRGTLEAQLNKLAGAQALLEHAFLLESAERVIDGVRGLIRDLETLVNSLQIGSDGLTS
jgi:hypothetical protein